MQSEFEKELEILINKYSKENDSNTPDFILARYLNAVLDNFSAAVKDREQWYGRSLHIEDATLIDFNGTGQPPPQFPTQISNPDVDLDSTSKQLES